MTVQNITSMSTYLKITWSSSPCHGANISVFSSQQLVW